MYVPEEVYYLQKNLHKCNIKFSLKNSVLFYNFWDDLKKQYWGFWLNKKSAIDIKFLLYLQMHCILFFIIGEFPDEKQVILNYDNNLYLLCTLTKGILNQMPLDLNFEAGSIITFTSTGSGTVHLTGYLQPNNSEISNKESFKEEDIPEQKNKRTSTEKQKATNMLKKEAKKRPRQDTVESSSEDTEKDSESEKESEDDVFVQGKVEEDSSDETEDSDVIDDPPPELPKYLRPEKKTKQNQELQKQQKKKKHDKQKINEKEVQQGQQSKHRKKNKVEQIPPMLQRTEFGERIFLDSGVTIEELKLGQGAVAKVGKTVEVYFVGRLKNGKKFDSVLTGEGVKFRVGKDESVIKGWNSGVVGMKVGGKRRLMIPAPLGYVYLLSIIRTFDSTCCRYSFPH